MVKNGARRISIFKKEETFTVCPLLPWGVGYVAPCCFPNSSFLCWSLSVSNDLLFFRRCLVQHRPKAAAKDVTRSAGRTLVPLDATLSRAVRRGIIAWLYLLLFVCMGVKRWSFSEGLTFHWTALRCRSTRMFIHASTLYYIPEALFLLKLPHFHRTAGPKRGSQPLPHLGPVPRRIYRASRRVPGRGRSSVAIVISPFSFEMYIVRN